MSWFVSSFCFGGCNVYIGRPFRSLFGRSCYLLWLVLLLLLLLSSFFFEIVQGSNTNIKGITNVKNEKLVSIPNDPNRAGAPSIAIAADEQELLQSVLSHAKSSLNKYNNRKQSVRIEDTTNNDDTVEASSSSFLSFSGIVDEMKKIKFKAMDLTNQYHGIIELMQEQRKLVPLVNKRILQNFIATLQDLSQKRSEQQQQQHEQQLLLAKKKSSSRNGHNETWVPLDRVQRLLTVDTILSEIDDELYEHIQDSILYDEIRSVMSMDQDDDHYDDYDDDYEDSQQHNLKVTSNCFTAAEAAKAIQVSLLRYKNDKIGIVDVLQHPATSIVHERTSPTFNKRPDAHTSATSSTRATLATTWWNKYVPADWEKYLFPVGWEQYTDPVTTIFQPFLEQWLHYITGKGNVAGGSGRTTIPFTSAPPEMILDPRTTPGYCWPMQNTANNVAIKNNPSYKTSNEGIIGYVTIRLPYPLSQLTGITIDHVPDTIVLSPNITLRSAPRDIRVYTYAPCDKVEGDECNSDGLGFDEKTLQLVQFQKGHSHNYYDTDESEEEISTTNSKTVVETITYQINPSWSASSVHHEDKNSSNLVAENDDDDDNDISFRSIQTFYTVYDDDEISQDGSKNNDVDLDDDGTCTLTKPTCGGPTSAAATLTSKTSSNTHSVTAIRIEIVSNWGNDDYTCLYRVRVHGEPLR